MKWLFYWFKDRAQNLAKKARFIGIYDIKLKKHKHFAFFIYIFQAGFFWIARAFLHKKKYFSATIPNLCPGLTH